jgi:flagellar hook-associated protein 1
MGSFALMSIGSRAMTANYTALQTSGHNIANAGVQGYSRQTVEMGTAQPQFTGGGYVGAGVDLQTVARSHNEFLTREAAATRSTAQADDARLNMLQKLEALFVPGEGGLGYAAGQFLNSMADLASQPSDLSTRQTVLARAGDFADRFRTTAEQIESIQADVRAATRDAVSAINGLASSLAQLNSKIVSGLSLGQPPNDLMDARDRLVQELSSLIQLTTIDQTDGSKSIFVTGGQVLVMGANASAFVVQEDKMDPEHRIGLAISSGGAVRDIDPTTLGGGSLAGWLDFQNDDLVQGRVLLGQMAMSLAGNVNQQQALGLDLAGYQGEPIFDFGEVSLFSKLNDDGTLSQGQAVRPAPTNSETANGGQPGQLDLRIDDYSQLKAAEYELSFNTAQQAWMLRPMAKGVPSDKDAVLLNASTPRDADGFYLVDGLKLDISRLGDGTADAAGDRYLLQPVTYAALDLTTAMDDFRGVAAASPVFAQAQSSNIGTGTVDTVSLTDTEWVKAVSEDASQSLSLSIRFGANGEWGLDQATWPAGLTVPSVTNGTWVAGQPIELGGLQLNLKGVPREGDIFTIQATTVVNQNNGNALSLLNLRDQGLVGRKRSEFDPQVFVDGTTFTDAYASALADIGVRVQGALSSAEVSASVADQAEQRRAGDAGVNLDEEAARLLQYQQSYQAAAKILQVAQTVFDTLLQAGR